VRPLVSRTFFESLRRHVLVYVTVANKWLTNVMGAPGVSGWLLFAILFSRR